MNDETIIKEMIDFIKTEEKDFQVKRLSADSKKSDIVDKIVKKLDGLCDENK